MTDLGIDRQTAIFMLAATIYYGILVSAFIGILVWVAWEKRK